MTNAELLAKIKAEIERLENYYTSVEWYVEALLTFLSTLESETPMQEGLEEEIDKYREEHLFDMPAFQQVARHFAQWGAEHAKIDVTDFCKPIDPGIAQCIADHSWEMLGEDEKPIQNDLEEAAEEYIKKGKYLPEAFVVRPAFIAGAKWQAEQYHFFNKAWTENMQAELDRNYENGKQAMKEQMLKEAVECYYGYVNNCTKVFLPEETLKGVKEGYVRIVILKNDE